MFRCIYGRSSGRQGHQTSGYIYSAFQHGCPVIADAGVFSSLLSGTVRVIESLPRALREHRFRLPIALVLVALISSSCAAQPSVAKASLNKSLQQNGPSCHQSPEPFLMAASTTVLSTSDK